MGLRYGATYAQLENDFGQENLGWRITRIQVAKYMACSVREVERMRRQSPDVLADIIGYMAAEAKNVETDRELHG